MPIKTVAINVKVNLLCIDAIIATIFDSFFIVGYIIDIDSLFHKSSLGNIALIKKAELAEKLIICYMSKYLSRHLL
jgi:hypothetical protein